MSDVGAYQIEQEEHETPFGPATLWLLAHASGRVALLLDEPEPRAALYAAKLAGATRVVELLSSVAVDRLLRPGDLLVPDDLVDLTSGQLQTFFVDKGYGFLGQRPVFCPELRTALLGGLRALPGRRSFARGVLGVVSDSGSVYPPVAPEQLRAALLGGLRAALAVVSDSESVYPGVAPGQLEEARAWGAHVVGTHGAPAAYLAKELELCYAVVCSDMWHERTDNLAYRPPASELIAAVLPLLPAARGCACKDAMQMTRQRGLIGDDWKTWM